MISTGAIFSTLLVVIFAFASNSNIMVATAFHSTPRISACMRDNPKLQLRASIQTSTEESSSTKSTNGDPPSHQPGRKDDDDDISATTAKMPTSSTYSPSTPSHVLTIDEMNPLIKFDKNGKQKVLNATGLLHLAVIISTMPFWLFAMETLQWLGTNVEDFDENRAMFDYSGKIWCRTYLSLTDCYPEIAGDVSRLKDDDGTNGACLFVANHASFLDIAVLCCVLDPVFKFIAKDSLKKFPGVGKQLVGGEHVLIDRTTKRSQLRTFKEAITYLKNGVPIMAFPEGARSPDGRLMPFKGGIFSMAVKAKVPIVPLSLANTHAVMPGAGLVPVQNGKGKLRVFVHDAISVEGKGEEEIAREVREALLSELPYDQHPLEEVGGESA